MSQARRWIIISNRLPYQYDATTNSLKLSSGGLVTAITGIHSSAAKIWVGAVLEDELPHWQEVSPPQSGNALAYDMVTVSTADYDRYYNGFCNDVLWPLFHYQSERVQFRHDDWEAYQRVNLAFAEKINEIATPDDLIWIHDFQLCLVPQYLKQLNPQLTVGWFLHIPFPSSELYLELPVRNELLQGILASDLVGFHDYAYVKHFCSTVQRILGIETSLFAINYRHHHTSIGVFPVSIDFNQFNQAAQRPEVIKLAQKYRITDFTFLGVDRLDYSKGIDLKIRAYYNLLLEHPELHEKVSLIQVAIPTRQDVDEYVKLRLDIEQLVSEVNGRFATPSWSPIHYLFHPVTFDELISLYRAADCLVVTSKRDGMNLVSLEYVAAQQLDDPGMVLISEFTGAKSLLSQAIAINPRDVEGTAKKMFDVIQMSRSERQHACQMMMEYLRHYTATDWGKAFIAKLSEIKAKECHAEVVMIEDSIAFVRQYFNKHKAKRYLLFIDYDGTLVPICNNPEEAVLLPEARHILQRLTQLPFMDVVIISGRDQYFLTQQLAGLDVFMAAEHGALFYDKQTWNNLALSDNNEWYQNTLQIMRDYTKLVPSSFIEQKTFCLSWHYRKSPSEFAEQHALKLNQELENGLSRFPARLIHGKKVIEVCATEANKGVFVHWFLENYAETDYGFAIGDDRTDEDVFAELKATCFETIRVGLGPTFAKSRLATQKLVLRLLNALLSNLV